MKFIVPKGATNRIFTVKIQANNVTTGAGLSGLDQTSGIVGGYVREGSTGVALAVDENVTTEGTYQAPSTVAHVRIGTPANMRAGTYELHFHNDLFLTGAESLTITLGGATNMADLNIEIQFDSQTAEIVSGVDAILADPADVALAVGARQPGDGTYTADQLLRVIAASTMGKVSGVGTGTLTFRNLADTADIAVVTVDATGRLSVTLTL